MENQLENQQLHVVFGAGQVGGILAQLLLDAGHRVRVVKRSVGGVPAGAELLLGDAADAAFCATASEGAAAVYHCMNPPYDDKIWAELVPVYMNNLIAAAARSGARLVVLDNVYMLGRPNGKPLSEDTAPNPCSPKGHIRAAAAETLVAAHQRGDVRVITGRASDFYGPGGRQTHFGDQFWRPALHGKTAHLLVNPDAVHTYHFIPDVAAGLATLGAAPDDAYGRPWMLPCAAPGTLRDIANRFATHLDKPFKVAPIPHLMLEILGAFVPIVRGIEDMLYQWDEPFIIDDSRFRAQFHGPIDPEDAAIQTVNWAKKTYH